MDSNHHCRGQNPKSCPLDEPGIEVVRPVGIEPTCHWQEFLRLQRLPVPPQAHKLVLVLLGESNSRCMVENQASSPLDERSELVAAAGFDPAASDL